jgi:hypothetical protein
MLNPGTFPLLNAAGANDFAITTAGTQVGTWVEDLDGMLAMLASLRFQWGSGGTSVKAYLQVSPDDGTTAIDIACAVFGVASEHACWNFCALTPKTTQVTPTDGTLADDTAVDGMLSNMVRLKVVSLGTYAGSTVLSGRITAR